MDEFRNRIRRVDDMLGGLDGLLDPAIRARIQELLGFLLDIHGEGLRRILDRLSREGASGQSLVGDLTRDEVVGGLLLLHGLHPQNLEDRIREALDRVRPQLASHGGNVELVAVDEQGVLRLRLEGACHGCPSSAATLRTTIEDAVLAAAPEVTELVLDTSGRPATEAVS
jgi:Fe-S cluster biogenesis protein NfuA